MKIQAKQVVATEIFVSGQSIGLFTEASRWNGLIELRRVADGQRLVVGLPDFGGMFERVWRTALGAPASSRLFGDDAAAETYLVNASDELVREIKAIVSEADTE